MIRIEEVSDAGRSLLDSGELTFNAGVEVATWLRHMFHCARCQQNKRGIALQVNSMGKTLSQLAGDGGEPTGPSEASISDKRA